MKLAAAQQLLEKEWWVQQLIYSWRILQLLAASLKHFLTTGGMSRAASLSYTTLLSTVPLFSLLVIVFRQVGGFEWLQRLMEPLLQQFLTPSGSGAVSQFLLERMDKLDAGTLGVFGVVFLVFGVYSLITTIETDLNGVWQVQRSRGVLRRLMQYWLMMTLLPLLAAAWIYLSGEAVVTRFLDSLPAWMSSARSDMLPMGIQLFLCWFIYWALPNTRVRVFPALFGALVAAFAWEGAKDLFTMYTLRATNINVVYGSLAALPLFMLWVFVSWNIVLIGAEFSYVIQNRRSLLRRREFRRMGPVPDYLIAVLLMDAVCTQFREGKRITAGGLADMLEIPEAELNRVSRPLREDALLRTTQDGEQLELLPGMPPNEIKVGRVMQLFMRHPDEFGDTIASKRFRQVMEWYAPRHARMLDVFADVDFSRELQG